MLVTLHSYKGGTGKTLLSVNLAMNFVDMGKKVCLLGLDLRAPSLSSTFNNPSKFWVNDYLSKSCKVENILTEYTPNYISSGHLFVGLADPSTESIREMSSKDRKWEMEALARLLSLKETQQCARVICDSSPGLQYSSINAIVAADVVLVVTSIDKSDIDGTQRMINDLYDLYEKKTGIVVNKVPETIFSGKTHLKLDTHKLPVVSLVPCSCDVLQSGGEYLFAFEKHEHPVTNSIRNVSSAIDKLSLH